MAYKNKKEYKEDKRKWNNGRMQARMQGGYQDFKVREAAWLQMQALKDDDKKKSKSKSKSDKKPDRGSGKFEDIKGALKNDAKKGSDAAKDLASKQVAADNKRIKELESLILSQKNQFSKQQQAFTSQLADLKLGFADQLGQYQSQISDYKGLIGDMKSDYAQSLNSLENRYDKKVGQLGGTIDTLQGQLTNSQQQFQTAESARLFAENRADNLRSAFVPQANPTATSVSYGDDREAVTTTRKARDNRLSDLTVLSGLGTAANPLAGLQLA